MKLNDAAVRKARSMIESSQYVIDSSWEDANPSSEDENAFLDGHSWDDYGEWHLGVEHEASEETKERYAFPYGDFRRVHRSGLIAAKQRASQTDRVDIEHAADELLTLIDERRS